MNDPRPRIALRALAATLLALALGACEPPNARPSPLHNILESGTLRVATAADLPPLAMRDRDGELIGLEIDLVRTLATTMDLKVSFVQVPFAQLIPAIERGEVDLAVSGMTITPERNARVAFAGPYFISGNTLLTRSPELADTEDPAALNDAKYSFAALDSSTSARFVAQSLPNAKLVTKPDNESGVKALLAGEVDGLVADLQVCALARWRNPDAGLHMRFQPFTTEPLGIALAPDAPLLLNLVSNYLVTLEETGELAQLKAEWLGDGAWVERLP